jgi:predicted hydrolase (HD superfamily)
MRKRLMKSFLANEKAAMAAMARRWGSTKYVQDMWELLAKLEGEMTKEAGEGARGISVIILQNNGASPLDPEVFREAARRKALEGRAPAPWD